MVGTLVAKGTGPSPPVLGTYNRQRILARSQRQGVAAPVSIAADDGPKLMSPRVV